MKQKLQDIVAFRGDRLFNGAVNIDWFKTDVKRASAASRCFVFHGPEYHGVNQEDVGAGHGHRLVDTATFAQTIVRRCYGFDDEQPFSLAIAGYGTGKSHLGVAMASLLSTSAGEDRAAVLDAIEAADGTIGASVRKTLDGAKPCLVVAIDGMRGCNLAAEMVAQISIVLRRDGLFFPKMLNEILINNEDVPSLKQLLHLPLPDFEVRVDEDD